MNYYPFHIGDYLSATRHLSWEEDAAYRRLLDTYYTQEKPLPSEIRAVCRLVLASTDTQREAVQVVLEEFFELTDDGWVNRRADAEIVAMQDKQQKQRDRANKRWHKPEDDSGNASAMPRHPNQHATASESDANAMPPTPTPTPTPVIDLQTSPKARRKQQYPADFYPNETGQAAATAKGIVIAAELEKFRDYHTAKGSTMADWQAAWRTWVGNARPQPAARTSAEPAWRTEQRTRTLQAVPSIASQANPIDFFDVEAKNVTTLALG